MTTWQTIFGVDPRQRPVVPVDHPDRLLAGRDRGRPVADADWPARSARARLDAGQRARLLARHPERAGAGGDRCRVRGQRD